MNPRVFGLVVLVLCTAVWGEEPLYMMPHSATTNPCDYSLANPVPKDKTWNYEPDRPTRANTAYTIEPGRLSIESGLLYTNNTNNGETAHRFDIADTQLRLGVTCNTELDVAFTPFIWEQTDQGAAETFSGFGDTKLAVRYSLWQTEKSALSVRPFVTFPTGQDNLSQERYSGGITIPYSYNVSQKLSLWEMPGISYDPDSSGAGYHTTLVNAAGVQVGITEKLKVFGELYVQANTEQWSATQATADVGVVYLMTENLQLDAGAYIGLTDDADDLVAFAGASYRL